MQTRISFNGGEIDEDVALRQDIDGMQRACLRLENWHITDGGALERRRGFVKMAVSKEGARLVPYVYTHADLPDMRYLVEVRKDETIVYDTGKKKMQVVERIDNVHELGFEADPDECSVTQINAMLLFTSLKHPPYVLKWDGKGKWEMERYELNPPPWQDDEEKEVRVKGTSVDGEAVSSLEFEGEDEENVPQEGDSLRVTRWVADREEGARMWEVLENYSLPDGQRGVVIRTPDSSDSVPVLKGRVVAVYVHDSVQAWTTKEDWVKEEIYQDGLDDPSSYPGNFIQKENRTGDIDGFGTTLPEVCDNDLNPSKADGKIAKGTTFGMDIAYWKYFTALKDIQIGGQEGKAAKWYEERPETFRPGVAVGNPVACGGKWQFYCSGLWYGAYAVMRNFETDALESTAWETAGISYSRVGAPMNMEITGDESEEECYLQLYLLSSRCQKYGAGDERDGYEVLKYGFPPDVCNNKLIVEGFMHDEILEYKDKRWERKNKVKVKLEQEWTSTNWSWSAFSWRYGYPMHSCVYNKRLVFASTSRMPQTLYLSCVDDLKNFRVGEGESSAFIVSLSTGTQNPICWLTEKAGSILLGTSEGEWEFGAATTASGVSAINNAARTHSFNGSANYVSVIGTKNRIVYIQRGGRRVNDFGYDLELDGYRSRDISIMNQHITGEHGGIVRGAMVNVPRCELIFVLKDGQVAICTYNDDQQVKAWCRWKTNGFVKDVCTITNGNGDDIIYFLVQRGTNYNIEMVAQDDIFGEKIFRDEPKGGAQRQEYESVVVTNALNNIIEYKVEQMGNIPFKVRLGKAFRLHEPGKADAGYMQVSRDGISWVNIDRRQEILPAGWHELVALPGWMEEPKIGIKITGGGECQLLCLQG